MTIPQEKTEALERLTAALKGSPVSVRSCLRHRTEASVFDGAMAGQPVILKQFHADGPARLERMRTELDLVATQMLGSPHGINRLLHSIPDLGVAVLEHAGEIRLATAIAASPANRPAMMRQAAEWLAAYVGTRRRSEPFRPRRWLNRMEANLAQLDPSHPVLTRTRKLLKRLAQRVAGCDITRAATHGDFVSINAMWANGRIIGIDVQGESWLPLARDMARFLVWQELTDPAPGPRKWGVAQDDLNSFLSVPLLMPSEAESVLPFFIGQELVQRLLDLNDNPLAVDRGLKALRAWGSDVGLSLVTPPK